ncbi:toxin-antitoxin system HicB family antitoxin [Oceanobacillus sp. FSL H7-0719]|uniref:toxin-antitoxin system HicB family antitoxin n=1 Tax=Oceanobacillus sp. FSL H7-0719 TaxID=2954507 RepID=UPI003248D063
MNKNDTNIKRLTVRINKDLNERIENEAINLGLTKNGFISMVLHKEFKKKEIK